MAESPLASQLANKTALLVGLGGLGCPAAVALARAQVGRLILVDDDVVDASNLHRQVLYQEEDVGRHKLEVARERLLELGAPQVELVYSRILPENARELVRQADVVVEGADNFATKFLTGDACLLEAKPLAQGAAIRWHGTAFCLSPQGKPCYRCLFEDVLPGDRQPNCAEAGVMGSVVGFVGSLLADLALDLLLGDESRVGTLYSFDGKTGRLRPVRVHPREDCPLCGPQRSFQDIEEFRYYEPTCAAPSRLAGGQA